MGRPKAQNLWDQVTILEDGRVLCKHCGHKFKGGASRIKAHLTRKEKKGVAICPNPPYNFCENEGVDENNVRPSPLQGAVDADPMNLLQGKSCVQAHGTGKQHGHEGNPDESAAQAGIVAAQKSEDGESLLLVKNVLSPISSANSGESARVRSMTQRGDQPGIESLLEFSHFSDINTFMSELGRDKGSTQLLQFAPNKGESPVPLQIPDNVGFPHGYRMVVHNSSAHLTIGESSPREAVQLKPNYEANINRETKAQQLLPYHHSSGKELPYKVGPFRALILQIEADDSKLLEYVFQEPPEDENQKLAFNSEVIVLSKSKFSSLDRYNFTTLKPKTCLVSTVIDYAAEHLTYKTRNNKESKHSIWCLPLLFSNSALGEIKAFIEFVHIHVFRENFMSNFKDCEKMLIPVYIDLEATIGHYYLYVVHLEKKVIEIWDSWCPLNPNPYIGKQEDRARDMLRALDKFFEEDINKRYSGGWTFQSFKVERAEAPKQSNGYDCGIFVIKFMINFVENSADAKSNLSFESHALRLALALEMLKSDINEQREALFIKADQWCQRQQIGEDMKSRYSSLLPIDSEGQSPLIVGDCNESLNTIFNQSDSVPAINIPEGKSNVKACGTNKQVGRTGNPDEFAAKLGTVAEVPTQEILEEMASCCNVQSQPAGTMDGVAPMDVDSSTSQGPIYARPSDCNNKLSEGKTLHEANNNRETKAQELSLYHDSFGKQLAVKVGSFCVSIQQIEAGLEVARIYVSRKTKRRGPKKDKNKKSAINRPRDIFIMDRPKAQNLWDQVTILEDGWVQCDHCRHMFKGGASRIKAHLTRKEKQGVAICPNPPHIFCENEGVDENNDKILTSINLTTQHYLNVEAENTILRAQIRELNHRLQSLNEIIDFLNESAGVYETDHSDLTSSDNFMNPLNIMLNLNLPIMASADMFQY